jgi:hypothetical protein
MELGAEADGGVPPQLGPCHSVDGQVRRVDSRRRDSSQMSISVCNDNTREVVRPAKVPQALLQLFTSRR